MKRTAIGNHFGQLGMYVSQPGDDLDNPQKSLLLDSRAATTLSIHFAERVPLTANNQFNDSWRYTTTRSYPALGYAPKYFYSLVARGENTAMYPQGIFLRRSGLQTANVNFNSGGMTAEFVVLGNEIDMDLMYVIFRNPLNG